MIDHAKLPVGFTQVVDQSQVAALDGQVGMAHNVLAGVDVHAVAQGQEGESAAEGVADAQGIQGGGPVERVDGGIG